MTFYAPSYCPDLKPDENITRMMIGHAHGYNYKTGFHLSKSKPSDGQSKAHRHLMLGHKTFNRLGHTH